MSSGEPSLQDNWSIPYKREESLGRCLVAATKLAAEGLLEQVVQHLSKVNKKQLFLGGGLYLVAVVR